MFNKIVQRSFVAEFKFPPREFQQHKYDFTTILSADTCWLFLKQLATQVPSRWETINHWTVIKKSRWKMSFTRMAKCLSKTHGNRGHWLSLRNDSSTAAR